MCLDLAPGCGKASALWASIGASIVQTKVRAVRRSVERAAVRTLSCMGRAHGV